MDHPNPSTQGQRPRSSHLALGRPSDRLRQRGEATTQLGLRRVVVLEPERWAKQQVDPRGRVVTYFAEPGQQRLQLMTLHRAKGLEFDEVLLVGCGKATRGDRKPLLRRLDLPGQAPLLVPKPPSSRPADDDWCRLFDFSTGRDKAIKQAEGLRLLYVATTRAKSHLHLLASGARDDADPITTPPHFEANSFAERLSVPFPMHALPEAHAPQPFDRSRAPIAPRLPLAADALLAHAAHPRGLPGAVERGSSRWARAHARARGARCHRPPAGRARASRSRPSPRGSAARARARTSRRAAASCRADSPPPARGRAACRRRRPMRARPAARAPTSPTARRHARAPRAPRRRARPWSSRRRSGRRWARLPLSSPSSGWS